MENAWCKLAPAGTSPLSVSTSPYRAWTARFTLVYIWIGYWTGKDHLYWTVVDGLVNLGFNSSISPRSDCCNNHYQRLTNTLTFLTHTAFISEHSTYHNISQVIVRTAHWHHMLFLAPSYFCHQHQHLMVAWGYFLVWPPFCTTYDLF